MKPTLERINDLVAESAYVFTHLDKMEKMFFVKHKSASEPSIDLRWLQENVAKLGESGIVIFRTETRTLLSSREKLDIAFQFTLKRIVTLLVVLCPKGEYYLDDVHNMFCEAYPEPMLSNKSAFIHWLDSHLPPSWEISPTGKRLFVHQPSYNLTNIWFLVDRRRLSSTVDWSRLHEDNTPRFEQIDRILEIIKRAPHAFMTENHVKILYAYVWNRHVPADWRSKLQSLVDKNEISIHRFDGPSDTYRLYSTYRKTSTLRAESPYSLRRKVIVLLPPGTYPQWLISNVFYYAYTRSLKDCYPQTGSRRIPELVALRDLNMPNTTVSMRDQIVTFHDGNWFPTRVWPAWLMHDDSHKLLIPPSVNNVVKPSRHQSAQSPFDITPSSHQREICNVKDEFSRRLSSNGEQFVNTEVSLPDVVESSGVKRSLSEHMNSDTGEVIRKRPKTFTSTDYCDEETYKRSQSSQSSRPDIESPLSTYHALSQAANKTTTLDNGVIDPPHPSSTTVTQLSLEETDRTTEKFTNATRHDTIRRNESDLQLPRPLSGDHPSSFLFGTNPHEQAQAHSQIPTPTLQSNLNYGLNIIQGQTMQDSNINIQPQLGVDDSNETINALLAMQRNLLLGQLLGQPQSVDPLFSMSLLLGTPQQHLLLLQQQLQQQQQQLLFQQQLLQQKAINLPQSLLSSLGLAASGMFKASGSLEINAATEASNILKNLLSTVNSPESYRTNPTELLSAVQLQRLIDTAAPADGKTAYNNFTSTNNGVNKEEIQEGCRVSNSQPCNQTFSTNQTPNLGQYQAPNMGSQNPAERNQETTPQVSAPVFNDINLGSLLPRNDTNLLLSLLQAGQPMRSGIVGAASLATPSTEINIPPVTSFISASMRNGATVTSSEAASPQNTNVNSTISSPNTSQLVTSTPTVTRTTCALTTEVSAQTPDSIAKRVATPMMPPLPCAGATTPFKQSTLAEYTQTLSQLVLPLDMTLPVQLRSHIPQQLSLPYIEQQYPPQQNPTLFSSTKTTGNNFSKMMLNPGHPLLGFARLSAREDILTLLRLLEEVQVAKSNLNANQNGKTYFNTH